MRQMNPATNNVGQMFTQDKPVVTVGAEKLEDLQQKADDGPGKI